MDFGWRLTHVAASRPTLITPVGNKILYCDLPGSARLTPAEQIDRRAKLDAVVGDVLKELPCKPADVAAMPATGGVLLNFRAAEPDIHLRAAILSLKHWSASGISAGLRIGLDTDDDAVWVDVKGQPNVIGSGGEMAGRIVDLARPGQILMHGRVRDALGETPTYRSRLSFRGEFPLATGAPVPVAQFVDRTMDFISADLIEPGVAAAPMSFADMFSGAVTGTVLKLELEAQDRHNVRLVQRYVEDRLLREPPLQSVRLRASWVAGELLENAFAHGRLAPQDRVQLSIASAGARLRIEVRQPEPPGFDRASILTGAAASESFLHIMGLGGQRPTVYGEAGKLVVTIDLPLDEGLSDALSTAHEAAGETNARNAWSARLTGGHIIASPAGRVDETTWEQFSAALLAAVRQAQASDARLTLDLSGLDYMSSRGLRVLTIARREAGDRVPIVLAAPSARMREILAVSRYDKLFQIVDDIDAA